MQALPCGWPCIITVVSADLVEQCRMFFRFYTVVEQVPPRDIYVVQANASASLRQCFEPLVPPLNVVPFQRRPPGRPLLLRASRGSTGHSGAGESFHHRGWMDMAMTLQRELLHHRAYTHTLTREARGALAAASPPATCLLHASRQS